MKVILLENLAKIGSIGEIIDVKRGFARNYLISNKEFKEIIYLNLIEDVERFLPLFNTEIISVDLFLSVMMFIFLIILYSTKFYTYVNELTFSLNRNLLDEFFQIYLLWTSYLFGVFYIFRFENVSRGYTFILTFLVPIILVIFRNPEFLSSLLGRSVTNENYLSINLDENSNFRNLRIITFRKNLENLYKDIYKLPNLKKSQNVYLPNDKETITFEQRKKNGIPITKEIKEDFKYVSSILDTDCIF